MNDISFIAYCGLNCADCFSYKKSVSEAAKSLRRELRAAKVKDFWTDIPFLGDYATFKKSLDGLAMLRCSKTCREGAGNPWCKIRKCCQKKEVIGCWECVDRATCGKLVERNRENIEKIAKVGLEKFLSMAKKS